MKIVKEYLQDMSSRGDAQADYCLEWLAQNEKEFEEAEGYHTTKVFTTVDCDHGPCIGHTFKSGWVMYTYTDDLARVSFHHPDEEDDAQAELDALKSYDVEIRGTVRKTITVEAGDERSAAEQAHEEFTVASNGDPEHYEQDTLSIKETNNGA